jgi:hypothetical protein
MDFRVRNNDNDVAKSCPCFVRAHRRTIRVEDNPGGGAVFTVGFALAA